MGVWKYVNASGYVYKEQEGLRYNNEYIKKNYKPYFKNCDFARNFVIPEKCQFWL